MANPQKENGHIDIANEIAEALAKTQLSGHETRVFWALLRKTWGWVEKDEHGKIKKDKKGKLLKKIKAAISSKEWIGLTGLDKYIVSRTLRELELRQIVIKFDNKNTWGPQKDFDRWLPPIKKIVVKNDNTYFVVKNDNVFSKIDNKISKIDNKKIPKELSLKEHRSSKETLKRNSLKKEEIVPKKYEFSEIDMQLIKRLKTQILNINPGKVFRGKDWDKKNAEQIRLMRRYDKRSIEDIEAVLDFAFKDKFWAGVIQSAFSLRKNYDMMKGQMGTREAETDGSVLMQAKRELGRLSSKKRILEWLNKLPVNEHGKLKKYLDFVYPRGHSYEEAKDEHDKP